MIRVPPAASWIRRSGRDLQSGFRQGLHEQYPVWEP